MISLCPVSFPKCLAAPAPSPVIWSPTSSADYFLHCFTSWITLFCLSLLPYCPQTVPSPTSTSPASERTLEVRGLTGSPALKGPTWGNTSWLYSFLCLQNSASGFSFTPLGSGYSSMVGYAMLPGAHFKLHVITNHRSSMGVWAHFVVHLVEMFTRWVGKRRTMDDSIVTVSQLKLFNRLQSCLSLWCKTC